MSNAAIRPTFDELVEALRNAGALAENVKAAKVFIQPDVAEDLIKSADDVSEAVIELLARIPDNEQN